MILFFYIFITILALIDITIRLAAIFLIIFGAYFIKSRFGKKLAGIFCIIASLIVFIIIPYALWKFKNNSPQNWKVVNKIKLKPDEFVFKIINNPDQYNDVLILTKNKKLKFQAYDRAAFKLSDSSPWLNINVQSNNSRVCQLSSNNILIKDTINKVYIYNLQNSFITPYHFPKNKNFDCYYQNGKSFFEFQDSPSNFFNLSFNPKYKSINFSRTQDTLPIPFYTNRNYKTGKCDYVYSNKVLPVKQDFTFCDYNDSLFYESTDEFVYLNPYNLLYINTGMYGQNALTGVNFLDFYTACKIEASIYNFTNKKNNHLNSSLPGFCDAKAYPISSKQNMNFYLTGRSYVPNIYLAIYESFLSPLSHLFLYKSFFPLFQSKSTYYIFQISTL